MEPLLFTDLPGWADDDHAAALTAFRLSARRHLDRPLRSRDLSPLDGFGRVARLALELDGSEGAETSSSASSFPIRSVPAS